MGHRYIAKPTPDIAIIHAALEAMDAEELRSLIRDIIPSLDDAAEIQLGNLLIDRAAHNASGWAPQGPSPSEVVKIVAFAEEAKKLAEAKAYRVDEYLRQGTNAFLNKDYQAAIEVFRALLIPAGNGSISLGHYEMLDDVLGVDVNICASQYMVSVYMTAMPSSRGQAVLSALDEMDRVGHFWEPLKKMEEAALEPMPQFELFLAQWRTLVEERAMKGSRNHTDDWDRDAHWDRNEDRWLREVVVKIEGSEGLARLARTTRRVSDLSAWCRAIVKTDDWKASLAVYDEASELVADTAYSRGEFFDGAALATQELGGEDLPKRLARAWREVPDMVRLCRWLGSSKTKTDLIQYAKEALLVVPKKAHRQCALLLVLNADFCAAAKLLAAAPGLGWSDEEHPGHLLFPWFCKLFGVFVPCDLEFYRFGDRDSLSDTPRLLTPKVSMLLDRVEVAAPSDAQIRTEIFKAMRKAAEERIEDVVANKYRKRYEHAASLALACVAVDKTPETEAWMAMLRTEYRRFSALQREFNRNLEG